MSNVAINQVIARSPWKGSPSRWAVHVAVANRVNTRHRYHLWAHRDTIAEEAGGVSRRIVDEWFTEAEEMGLLICLRRGRRGRSGRYLFNLRLLATTEEVLNAGQEAQVEWRKFAEVCREYEIEPMSHNARLDPSECGPSPDGPTSVQTHTKYPDTKKGKTQTHVEQGELSSSTGQPSPHLPANRDKVDGREIVDHADVTALEEAPSPQPPSPADDGPTAIARRVFEAWVEATGRDLKRVKLNKKRLDKIRARLKEGYEEEELIEAVRGVALSPFHMGDNDRRTKYDDITVVCRDGSQVEKFSEMYRVGDGGRPSSPTAAIGAALDAGVDGDAEIPGWFR